MSHLIMLFYSILAALICQCYAQDQLPDSIPDSFGTNCLMQQAIVPEVCCVVTEGSATFCSRQCVLPPPNRCVCIDSFTGMKIENLEFFPEPEDGAIDPIDCLDVFPPTEVPETTETAATAPPATTAAPMPPATTAAPMPLATTAAPMPLATTEAPMPPATTAAPVPPATTVTPEALAPTEEPTEEEEEEEETSRSSGTSGSSRSRTTGSRSRPGSRNTRTRSSGTSGSNRTQTGTGSTSRSTGSRSPSTMSRLSRGSRRCPRVDEITSEGCSLLCVVEDRYGCPSCDESCQRVDDVCSGCTESQVCVRMGRFGTHTCVERPALGERCDGGSDEEGEQNSESSRSRSEDSTGTKRRKSRVRKTIRGARERQAFGRLEEVELECRDELVCVEVEEDRSVCQAENPNGPCVIARATSPLLICTPEGDFEPLQCGAGFPTQCQCVEPSDGTPVPDTLVMVEDPADLPDCDEEVFESCVSDFEGTLLGVPHGEYAVDVANCRRCLCNDGGLVECEPSQTCQSIRLNPISCEHEGETISHGEQFDVDCNKCGCYNGIIRCTRRRCESNAIRDRCDSCDSEAYSHMCGLNGVTYPSMCHAVFCSAQIPFTLTQGSCNDMDVCSRFPCDEGETCIKRGGTSCIGSCQAEDLRICVNLDELVCEDTLVTSEDAEMNSRALCATNGVTYPSLCHLIQDTGNEGVAYAGACNSDKCSGGNVCGTDGITYENVCILRSTSANTRVDYAGPCTSDAGSVEATCENVRQNNRCANNADNCRFLVNSVEGCCPLCGGLVTVALEFRGMMEYVRINPQVRVLDVLYAFLVESGIIPDEVVERCEIEFSTFSNLEIALLARTSDDQEFCNAISATIAEVIDNPQELTSYVPDSFQFATAAVGGLPVADSGSVRVAVHSFLIFCAVVASSLF